MKISKILTIITLVYFTIQKCQRNCFLGESFYSAPLDKKGCCRYKWAKNCRQFVAISKNKFMCDSCKLGYKWKNNKCVKLKENQNCINPELNAIPFNPCRICKFSKKIKFVPIFNEKNKKTEQYECKQMGNLGLSDHIKNRLKFCEASGALENEIFCYRCIDGYYFDWRLQKCKQILEKSVFGGCLISVDSAHCSICRREFQFDQQKEICVERKIKINLDKLNKIKVDDHHIGDMENVNNQQMQMMIQNINGGQQMPNMNGGQMPNMNGGQMPNMNGGQMPNMNGGQMQNMMAGINGGQMPNMNGGQMQNMMPGMNGGQMMMPGMNI